ncbi:MAG: hypothetical protein MUD10_03320 [Candidatus Pacebacteria bacterium]|jgi:hypothetical protein|nr:hypothetical protein [Candidatus Paceibacterota bacterium]
MDTIKECLEIVLNGNEKESRMAARGIRKIVYGARPSKDDFWDIKKAIYAAPANYAKISEEWRQENFAMAISVIYFLHSEETGLDFLFPWLFELLQHPNGYIRQAAVRMFGNDIGPLTVHIRCPEFKQSKSKSARSDEILRDLSASLSGLITMYWKPEYEKHKYIDSLPPSPYKSAQLVLFELQESSDREYYR